jgi:glycosyltransferase involved in cell wall biosynthesis
VVGQQKGELSGSVVVPAHQEANALPFVLSSILHQDLGPNCLHVVVVDNGSDDGSAAVAKGWRRRFAERGHLLSVRQLAQASKAAALNEGDRVAGVFPRVYLDADVTLSPNALRRTIEVLRASELPRMAAPRVQIADVASRLSTSYGRLWSQLPYISAQVPGVGFYAVNEGGRRRWTSFPLDIGADDKFARLHFAPDEVEIIGDAWFAIHLPERARELIRVRGRWTGLNLELRRLRPDLAGRDHGRLAGSARHVLANPRLWRDAPAFLTVWVLGYGVAGLRSVGLERRWARAPSSAVRSPGARLAPKP